MQCVYDVDCVVFVYFEIVVIVEEDYVGCCVGCYWVVQQCVDQYVVVVWFEDVCGVVMIVFVCEYVVLFGYCVVVE